QEHVLAFYPSLTPVQQESLLEQISGIDLKALPGLIDRYVVSKPKFELPAGVEPAPYFPADPKSLKRPWDKAAAKKRGEELIRKGKIAAFVVAGGQGSRLGYEGPKGCYPAGAVTKKPLFQMFAEQLLATKARYGAAIPWYIMTSPLNHRA